MIRMYLGRALLLVGLACGLVGCSGGGIGVKGKLVANGQPLTYQEQDQIELTLSLKNPGPKSRSYYGQVNKSNGTFLIQSAEGEGVPPGVYRVAFGQSKYGEGGDLYQGKYSTEQTPLEITVTEDPNQSFTIDLETGTISKP